MADALPYSSRLPPDTGAPSLASRLVRRLNRITAANPGLGLRLSGLAGLALGARLGDAWTPSAAEVRGLLGELEARAVGRLQRRIASGELRNRALLFLLRRRGPAPMLPLMRVRGAERLARLRAEKVPVIVVFWHLGVVRSIETALVKLGCPVLASTNQPQPGPDPGFRCRAVTDAASGTRFMMEALRELGRGGVPVLAVDGSDSHSCRAPFLGRSLPVASGAGALARRAGACVVPATSRWIGSSAGIEVTLHDPLPVPSGSPSPPEWERVLVTSAVGWFERHLLAHPGDLRPLGVRRILNHLEPSLVTGSEAGGPATAGGVPPAHPASPPRCSSGCPEG